MGPAADGKIPLLQQERLLDLGEWLKINGMAIYGTRPYKKFYEMKTVYASGTSTQIDFDWKRNSPDPAISCDHFQAHWQGVFYCLDDTYTFEIQTDDQARLLIDGETIIDDTRKSSTGKKKLSRGQHSIDVFYEEDELEATISLYWSSKKMPKQVMTGFQMGAMLPTQGLKVTYSCEQPLVCYTTKNNPFTHEDELFAIALEFPKEELILHLDQPSDQMKVQLMGGHNPSLPWHYEDGQLIIQTDGLRYNDVKSRGAWVFRLSQSGL